MSYNFTTDNLSEFISFSKEDKYCINFPEDCGSMVCEKEIITNDIILFKTNIVANTNLSIKSDSSMQGGAIYQYFT